MLEAERDSHLFQAENNSGLLQAENDSHLFEAEQTDPVCGVGDAALTRLADLVLTARTHVTRVGPRAERDATSRARLGRVLLLLTAPDHSLQSHPPQIILQRPAAAPQAIKNWCGKLLFFL